VKFIDIGGTSSSSSSGVRKQKTQVFIRAAIQALQQVRAAASESFPTLPPKCVISLYTCCSRLMLLLLLPLLRLMRLLFVMFACPSCPYTVAAAAINYYELLLLLLRPTC
jgi:hypothetical protein